MKVEVSPEKNGELDIKKLKLALKNGNSFVFWCRGEDMAGRLLEKVDLFNILISHKFHPCKEDFIFKCCDEFVKLGEILKNAPYCKGYWIWNETTNDYQFYLLKPIYQNEIFQKWEREPINESLRLEHSDDVKSYQMTKKN